MLKQWFLFDYKSKRALKLEKKQNLFSTSDAYDGQSYAKQS